MRSIKTKIRKIIFQHYASVQWTLPYDIFSQKPPKLLKNVLNYPNVVKLYRISSTVLSTVLRMLTNCIIKIKTQKIIPSAASFEEFKTSRPRARKIARYAPKTAANSRALRPLGRQKNCLLHCSNLIEKKSRPRIPKQKKSRIPNKLFPRLGQRGLRRQIWIRNYIRRVHRSDTSRSGIFISNLLLPRERRQSSESPRASYYIMITAAAARRPRIAAFSFALHVARAPRLVVALTRAQVPRPRIYTCTRAARNTSAFSSRGQASTFPVSRRCS